MVDKELNEKKDWFEKAYFNAALIEKFYEDNCFFVVAEDLRKFFLRPSLALRILIKDLDDDEKISILEQYKEFNSNNNNFKDFLDEDTLNEIQMKYLEKKDPIESVIEIYKEYDRTEDIDLSGATPTMLEPILCISGVILVFVFIFNLISEIYFK